MKKLYNGIILPDDFMSRESAADAPYLNNPPDIIDVSIGRQLFVDDFLYSETTLKPRYHKAVKYTGNPVLFPQTPWEKDGVSPVACPKSGGVWYDDEEKIFKMWYEAGWLHQMAYAVSADGIHWERPDLGLESGTNKILLYKDFRQDKLQGDLNYLRPDSTTVFIDSDTPDKSQRYKLYLRNPGGRYPGIAAVSSDGINWNNFKFGSEVYDRSTVFYNPFRKKWVYSIRDVWNNRCRSYRECDDYLEGSVWREDEQHKWMACDDMDKPNPYIGFKPQLYNVDAVGYESIMLGMFQIMYGPENDVCERSGVPKITELIPMYSRDGYNFTRPCRDSLINASLYKSAWDRGYIQSAGGVTVINGDELWIYYAGFGGDENYNKTNWFTNGIYRNGATGLAKLRRDGFVSMEGSGSIATRMLKFDGRRSMHVNLNGSLQIRILSPDGEEIAVSDIINTDSTDAQLDFGEFDLSSLNNTPFRLFFNIDGSIYSFRFADHNGSSHGARAAGVVNGI
jgi:hypothetical protein